MTTGIHMADFGLQISIFSHLLPAPVATTVTATPVATTGTPTPVVTIVIATPTPTPTVPVATATQVPNPTTTPPATGTAIDVGSDTTPVSRSTNTIDSMKSDIQKKSGIAAVDGESRTLPNGMSIVGEPWSVQDLQTLNNFISTLPASFRENTPQIERAKSFQREDGSVLNTALYDPLTGAVLVGVPEGKMTDFKLATLREMTHAFQANNPSVGCEWASSFWQGGKPITPAANQKVVTPTEDMAESAMLYWSNGPLLKKQNPYRYNFVRDMIFAGLEYSKPNN